MWQGACLLPSSEKQKQDGSRSQPTLTLAPLMEKAGVPGRYGKTLANSLSMPVLTPQVWLAPALNVKTCQQSLLPNLWEWKLFLLQHWF